MVVDAPAGEAAHLRGACSGFAGARRCRAGALLTLASAWCIRLRRTTPGSSLTPSMPKKLILAVIDGLGPELLDRAIAAGRAPTLARLQRARRAHRRLRLHLPLADAGLPVGADHRRAPGRLAHPQHDLVSPRRGPLRRVRVVVPGDAGRGHAADGRRRAGQPEPAAPVAAGDNGVRGARGRRAGHRGRQHLRLPRARAASDHPRGGPPRRPPGRASSTPSTGRAATSSASCSGRTRPARRATSAAPSIATAATSAAGWSPGTASTSCSCTCTRPTPRSIAAAT